MNIDNSKASFISGDQHPLRWGLVRAMVARRLFPHGNHSYFWHMADGQTNFSILDRNTRKVLAENGPFSLRIISSGTNVFTLMSKSLPFGLPHINPAGFRAGNPTKLGNALREFREKLPAGVSIVSSVNSHIKGNVGLKQTRSLAIMAFKLWFERMEMVIETLPVVQRIEAGWRLKLAYMIFQKWVITGQDVGDLYFDLSSLVLGQLIPISFQKRSTRISRELPSDLVETVPGYEIYSGSDGYIHRAEGINNERRITRIPKALYLYALLRSQHNLVSGGIPYEFEGAKVIQELGIHPKYQVIIKFKPGEVLNALGLAPDLSRIWIDIGADTPYKLQVKKEALDFASRYWLSGENPDSITTWVLGGYRAIKEIAQQAVVYEKKG